MPTPGEPMTLLFARLANEVNSGGEETSSGSGIFRYNAAQIKTLLLGMVADASDDGVHLDSDQENYINTFINDLPTSLTAYRKAGQSGLNQFAIYFDDGGRTKAYLAFGGDFAPAVPRYDVSASA